MDPVWRADEALVAGGRRISPFAGVDARQAYMRPPTYASWERAAMQLQVMGRAAGRPRARARRQVLSMLGELPRPRQLPLGHICLASAQVPPLYRRLHRDTPLPRLPRNVVGSGL